MTAIHICRVETYEYSRKETEPRWCFGCRKRLPGVFIVRAPVDIYSYYGPHGVYECDGCGKDRRCFPGYEFEEGDS